VRWLAKSLDCGRKVSKLRRILYCDCGKLLHPSVVDGSLTGFAQRRLTSVLTSRLGEAPAIMLNGPRTVGKSTLLSALGEHVGRVVIDCDDPAT
jgi:hypothetical protein